MSNLLRAPQPPQANEEMAPFDRTSCPDGSHSSNCLPQLHPRQHDEHDNYRHDNNRDDCNRTLWRKLQQLVGYERNCERSGRGRQHDLLDSHRWGRLSSRSCKSDSRGNGDRRHLSNNRANFGYNFAVGLLAVSCILPAAVKADDNTAVDGGITATASPTAVSTGQATNQAVQINQGGYSEQGYSPGHYCNSPTFTVTPFFLGSESFPEYVRGQNYGIQATISFPLDGEMVRLCKELAVRKIEKERLDYNLVRVKECSKLIQMGFMFHPKSPFAVICADVVPIARGTKSLEESSQTSSKPES